MTARPEVAFGEVLRAARQQRGLTQEQLAFESGYTRNFVGLLERGLRAPTLVTILRLATVLHVSPADLVAEVHLRVGDLRAPEAGVQDEE